MSVSFPDRPRKYLKIVFRIAASNLVTGGITFNGDTSSSYDVRASTDGAADATSTADTAMNSLSGATNKSAIGEVNIYNPAGFIKPAFGWSTRYDLGAPPNRREFSGIWRNNTSPITSITMTNGSTGDYGAGSEMIVLGHD